MLAISVPVSAISAPVPAISVLVSAVSGSVPAVAVPVPAIAVPVPAVVVPIPAVVVPIPAVSGPVPAVAVPVPASAVPYSARVFPNMSSLFTLQLVLPVYRYERHSRYMCNNSGFFKGANGGKHPFIFQRRTRPNINRVDVKLPKTTKTLCSPFPICTYADTHAHAYALPPLIAVYQWNIAEGEPAVQTSIQRPSFAVFLRSTSLCRTRARG